MKRVSVINQAIITINVNFNRAIVVGDLFHDSNAYGWNVEELRYTTCAGGGLSYCLNITSRDLGKLANLARQFLPGFFSG